MHRWYNDMPPARPRPCDRPVDEQQDLADALHAVMDDVDAENARRDRAAS